MPLAYPRQDRPPSPASTSSAATSTPARPKHVYSMSPVPSNASYSSTVTPGGQQQKLNVVTRVAIEGKAKKDKDGASVHMYLKLSIPLDQVQSGMTIPLFPEENVKILTSYVHPLNNHSVPYNFSSTLCPLLHKAARALNLPARSRETFNSAFSIPVTSPPLKSESRSVKPNKTSVDSGNENIATVDNQYTGHILVSGYQISYIVPKVFPTRPKTLSEMEGEDYARRRLSIGDRGSAQFMAAIDMWIPLVSHPPRYPYLLSIPVPRCLNNNIKLRIFAPAVPNASYASLSSIEEDGNSWDLTSDPHVTRVVARPSRSNSYSHFADDESSDSSTAGFSDGCGIQGTFPSAERIRIRWAKPTKGIDISAKTSGGRRRVGVREVKGEMTCIVRGKQRVKERDGADGVLLDVIYKGTCRGVWFPGVATLLGLDVGLETKGSDACWVDGAPNTWDVSGGGGGAYQGFDIGASPRQAGFQSRTASLESNNSDASQLHMLSSPQDTSSTQFARTHSTSSNISLMRAPLPAQAVGEYSFESSSVALSSTSSSALPSMPSLTAASSSSSLAVPEMTPGLPITLHVNIDELIAPANNVFTFTISGTILVVARPTLSSISNSSCSAHSGAEHDSPDPEPIVLPRFTVLAADSETTHVIVHNEIQDAPITVEVYNSTGDIYRDAQAKKTVLQKGGFTKCSDAGSRIALRSIGSLNGELNGPRHSKQVSGPRTPTAKTRALPRVSSNSPSPRAIHSRSARTGALSIPSVLASVTPFVRPGEPLSRSYAVRVCLDAPSDTGSEWLEFGLAKQDSNGFMKTNNGGLPEVVIVSTTVEGISVIYESTAGAEPEASGLGLTLDQSRGKEWINWVRMRVGSGGGTAVVDYIVSEHMQDGDRDLLGTKEKYSFHVFLPSFSIPVGRFEVNIETTGLDVELLRSNFVHQLSTSTGSRLLNYSMDEFFFPSLSMTIHPQKRTSWITINLINLITWALIIVGFGVTHRLNEQQIIRHQTGLHTPLLTDEWSIPLQTATTTTTTTTTTTITSTVYTSVTRTKWMEEPTPTSFETSESSSSYTGSPAMPKSAASPTSLAPPEKLTDTEDGIVDDSHHSQPSTFPTERYALGLPIQQFLNITWPTHDFDATVESMMHTLEKVWNFLRKAYHYPLDPP